VRRGRRGIGSNSPVIASFRGGWREILYKARGRRLAKPLPPLLINVVDVLLEEHGREIVRGRDERETIQVEIEVEIKRRVHQSHGEDASNNTWARDERAPEQRDLAMVCACESELKARPCVERKEKRGRGRSLGGGRKRKTSWKETTTTEIE
jgi:hypothetical protein